MMRESMWGSHKKYPKIKYYSNTPISERSNPDDTIYVYNDKNEQNYFSHEDTPQSDDLRNYNTHRNHEEILGSNDNTEGKKAINHPDNGVKGILNQVSSPIVIKDDTRINKHGHNFHSSESENDKLRRITNLIDAHTEALKDNIKRELGMEKFIKDINSKAYDNDVHDTNQHLQNLGHGHEESSSHDYGEGQSKASDNKETKRCNCINENDKLQHPSRTIRMELPENWIPSFLKKNETEPDDVHKYDGVFGGLTHSNYNEDVPRIKRV
ncbi:uncharacterized protein LOC110832169 isoform X2 [Zootermopsis nevadensis]|nr:uncharacterized protein LOC110832169 isoform X2 [Zootermopsis nevadensis]